MLRRTYMLGFPIGRIDKVFGVLLFAALLAGCAPVADFVAGQVNDAAGDSAELLLVIVGETDAGACVDIATGNGLCVDPGDEQALGVVLSVKGDDLAVEADCEPDAGGVRCELGDVTEPSFVEASGSSVSATITYRRDADGRVFQEVATTRRP